LFQYLPKLSNKGELKIKMDIKLFVKSFNEGFNKSLPSNFCKATKIREGFNIKIGDRDVDFDENGKVIGSGSAVSSTAKWEVKSKLQSNTKTNKKDANKSSKPTKKSGKNNDLFDSGDPLGLGDCDL